MKVTVSKMTLGEFIERMKDGWGFWRKSRVRRIGQALDNMIPHHLREKEVEVEYIRDSYGWGSDFHYSYMWRVEGVNFKGVMEGRLKPSTSDLVFGYSGVNLPYLSVIDNGFIVGYDW